MQDNGSDLDNLMPGISIDCVIFTFHEGAIKVLLNKILPTTKWSLPAGFIRKDEDCDAAAYRILKARTGIEDLYLKQFQVFGAAKRTNIGENEEIVDKFGLSKAHKEWFSQRFITIAYYALINYEEFRSTHNDEEEELQWFALKEIPVIYGDHKKIINTAIETIRMQLGYIPIGYELLPEKFTMPELRVIYETILGKELDRRNFQRKILSIGYVKRLNETRKNGAHKAPQLYSFIEEKYEMAREYGLQIVSWNLQESSL